MAATREASMLDAPDSDEPEALFTKLRPGPGRHPEAVENHQRRRLAGAMMEIVTDRGYSAVTVRELARLAGVSTRTVYEIFPDKEACYLEAFDLIVKKAGARILASQKGVDGWRKRLEQAFLTFASELERRPQAARFALVEALAAGPAGLERLRHAEELFEGLIRESFAHAPDGVEVPPLLVEGIVAGIARVSRMHLLAGEEKELPGLVDELMEWALCYRCESVEGLADLDRWPRPSRAGFDAAAREEREGERPGDERALIISAVAKLAAADGYPELTVSRIRAAAGISRRAFDRHFQGTAECFVTAVEAQVEQALRYADLAYVAAPTWPDGIRDGLETLCAYIAHDPVMASLAFVEVFAPGPDGLLCRERLMAWTAERLRRSAPAEQRPGRLAADATVGAVWGIVHHHVVSGQVHQLPHIAPALALLTMAPVIGAPEAMDTIRRGADIDIEDFTTERC